MMGPPLHGSRQQDTQAIFRLALDALARPGRVHQLPVAARDAPGNPWAAALLLTLLDHETSLWVAPGDAAAEAETFLRQRTAARPAPVEGADFVLADAGDGKSERLAGWPGVLRRGTLAYPDGAATLVMAVPVIEQESSEPEATEPDARSQERGAGGLRLTLSGPGVPPAVDGSAAGGRTLWVRGLGAEFFAAREEAVRDYPTGVDLFLVDSAGRLAGLPRSSAVQIGGDTGAARREPGGRGESAGDSGDEAQPGRAGQVEEHAGGI